MEKIIVTADEGAVFQQCSVLSVLFEKCYVFIAPKMCHSFIVGGMLQIAFAV
jgi:hypothetical protein